MQNFWGTMIGVQNSPLAYIVWEIAKVPMVPPPLVPKRPYSKEHGSVEREMISQLSHEHPVFDDDNATCFNHLEEATHGTIIAVTIQPLKRLRNGRVAWRSIIAQHCGDDKWEAEIKSSYEFLKIKIWKGNTNHSLERFMEKHR